jgi:4-hydroxy-2-oxoheptanedioate aldolase
MIENQLRKHLTEDRPAFGLFVNFNDPTMIELAGLAGFDFVHIDLQHTARGGETVVNLLRAAQAWGVGTLLRAPSPHSEFLSRLLDIGVDAVIAPDVKSYEDVRAVVDATRYPPLGQHGIGSSAVKYMRPPLEPGEKLPEFLNRTQVVGIMVETVEALEDLEKIVSVKGLDFVFFGPSDLSFAMGLSGEPGHPALREAVMKGIDVVKSAGLAWGTMPNHPAIPISPDELVEMGARIMVLSADVQLVMQAMNSATSTVAHLKR